LFCRYCGAALAKTDIKCPLCGKEQGPVFATNGYFGVLDKVNGQSVKTEGQTELNLPDKNFSKELQSDKSAVKGEISSKLQIGKGTIFLAFLMIVCTLLLCMKISSLKKALVENDKRATTIDSLSQAITRIEENQMQQDEVLDCLKQAVDTAKADSESPILDEPNADEKTQETEERASSTSTELRDDNTEPPVKTHSKQAYSMPDSVPPSIT